MSKMLRLRADKDDQKIVGWLVKKLGLNMSGVIRLALRRLYESEKKK